MHKSFKRIMIITVLLFFVSLFVSSAHDYGAIDSLATIIGTLSWLLFLIALCGGLIDKFRNRRRQPKAAEPQLNKLDRKMLAHYQAAGLSESDIVFFRKTMGEAETQIRQLSKNVAETPKLKTLDLNVDFVKVSKSMFAAIVKEPERISETGASNFLYRHLPTIVNLTTRYIEISHHEVKTTDTWEVLAKSLDVIKNLGNQIREDYTLFVSDDLTEMGQEMSAAQDSLSTAQRDALKMDEALAKVNASYEKGKEQQHGKQ